MPLVRIHWPIININTYLGNPSERETGQTAPYMLQGVTYMHNDRGAVVRFALVNTAFTHNPFLTVDIPAPETRSPYFADPVPEWLDACFEPFKRGRLIEVDTDQREGRE